MTLTTLIQPRGSSLSAFVLAFLLLAAGSARAQTAIPNDPEEQGRMLFGYRAVQVADNRGQMFWSVARDRSNGVAVSMSTTEFETVRRQLGRFVVENEWTARTWRNCPALIDFAAARFEAGVEYMGGAEGQNAHPHAWGRKFWSREPVFNVRDTQGQLQSWGDPIDGSVLFLVELKNAERADEFQAIWDDAYRAHAQLLRQRTDEVTRLTLWQQNRDRWIEREATLKAQNLIDAVAMVDENAGGLNLQANLAAGYGVVYRVYSDWITRSRNVNGQVDAVRVGQTIIVNSATYRDNPLDRGETYRSRLQKLFSDAMPPPTAVK